MKTKYLLSALALPALLAACVNDDFETQNQASSIVENDLLKGRAMGELVVSADKYGIGDEADTRVNGVQEDGGINWYWQPGDQLGAVVVNYGGDNRDEIVDGDADYVITNFPFNANLNEQARRATFSTPTAVVEGAYFFYNQYDREGIRRGKIQHSLNQYIDVKSGTENTGLIQVGTDKTKGQNFFISPITKVAVKDDEGEAMTAPVSLQSIYTVLDMKFNLELSNEFVGRDVKIYKVELERSEADGESTKKFRNNFTLDPLELAKLQKKVKDENPNAAWATVLRPADEDGSQTEAAVIDATNLDANRQYVEQAMAAVLEGMKDPQTLANCFEEGETKLIYQLETPYSFKDNNGKQMQLMVLVPSDIYELNSTEENRDGHNKGVLKMTVYTSEGIYRSYVIDEKALENWGATHEEYVEGQYTFQRGSRVGTTKTIRIGGDKSNITFYDFQNEGFPVATTADWNYAIDYINEHTSQFGGGQGGDQGNEWNFPVLNLSNYNDEPIEVDAAHYFPNMRVIYNGDAVLKLVNQSEYKLDPRNMIFGTEEKRPTILIEDQPESVVTFVEPENKPATIEDGENYTNAWKLNSDAKINVAENQTVIFEMLESHTALTIAKGASVEVLDDAVHTTLTEGTVTLAEGDAQTTTKFRVENEYTNNAVLSINKYAEATLVKAVTNNGTVDVAGRLDGENVFTNSETGALNVKAWEVSMNDDRRGQAVLAAVQNLGTINLEERKQDYSGTYGGDLFVEQKLDNRGEVMVEGILTVFDEDANQGEGLQNVGLIQLGYDPYAQIRVRKSVAKSQNTGKIVLLAPQEYEFYASYLNDEQDLNNYHGVIEATLDNETYKKVMDNYGRYTSQERAWEVINKVIVTDKLELEANTENAGIDFVLNSNASIDIAAEVTIASLTTAGTGTAITSAKAGTVFNVNEDVTVATGNDLTVGNGVELMLLKSGASEDAPMLDIAGTLTNNGSIDTKDGASEANHIYTAIRQGGLLKNNGMLSKEAVMKYDVDMTTDMTDLIAGLKENSTDYRGDFVANEARVDLINFNADGVVAGTVSATWNEDSKRNTNLNYSGNEADAEVIKNLIENGQVAYIAGYQALVVSHPTDRNWTYALYLGGGNNNDVKYSDEELNLWKTIASDPKAESNGDALYANYPVQGTWFHAQNWGDLDLSAGNAWGDVWMMSRNAGFKGSLTEGVVYPFK